MRVRVDHLRITVAVGVGHNHRLSGITRRALELLDEQIRARPASNADLDPGRAHPRMTVAPLAVDLRRLSDEAVSFRLAGALYGALRSREARNTQSPTGMARAQP